MYYTPQHIIEWMLRQVLEPCAGSGAFLLRIRLPGMGRGIRRRNR